MPNPVIQGAIPGTPASNQVAQMGAPGANVDLSSNYLNYLMQYQHQNANASLSTLTAMGTQGASNPIGGPPPNVPGNADTPSWQANATPDVATTFNFPGYKQQQPQTALVPLDQRNPAAAQLSAMVENFDSAPAPGAAANTSKAHAHLYASYNANMNAQAQSPAATSVPGSQNSSRV